MTHDLAMVRDDVMRRKRENAEVWQFSETSIGRATIDRRSRELEHIVSKYADIDTSKPAELVARALIANQVAERLIRKELDILTKTKEIAKTLDSELEKVDSALRMKEEAEKRSR